jgi:flagellar protein FliS
MVNRQALSQYQSINVASGIEDASPHRLIQMLMLGFMQRVAEAKGAIARNQVALKGEAITKALNILAGLQDSLNKSVESALPEQLDSLYTYMQHRLLEANLKNSEAVLDEVAQLMRTVKEGWDGIQ